jgi:starch synthase
VYRSDPKAWQALMRNGMAQEYSWTNSAREYMKVYERVRQLRAAAVG